MGLILRKKLFQKISKQNLKKKIFLDFATLKHDFEISKFFFLKVYFQNSEKTRNFSK